MSKLKFDEIIEINGKKLTKQYIQSLSKQERLDLIDPIFNILRDNGFIYPDDEKSLNSEWKKLLEYNPNIDDCELFNNSSLATNICKYFCHSFYKATEKNKPTMIDNFNNDETLKKIIHNRLGLDWLDDDEKGPGVNESFNLSFKMIAFQGVRSMRLTAPISIFKPSIAKYLTLKYSKDGDVIYDPSAGFGGRMLGVMSVRNRKYIATDPLTVPELLEMIKYFNFSNCELHHMGSEYFSLDEQSVDFVLTSPPYYNQEVYFSKIYTDNDKIYNQSYNLGESYFYNEYWRKTLDNVKKGLKSKKIFALNIHERYDRMINMAKETFGEPIDIVKLRTVKSHLTKTDGNVEKFEPVFIFQKS